MIAVNLPSKLEVAHEADVVVIGGGPGGIGAAVAAARGGAEVLLVEHYGFLGGMATAGEVNPFMPNHLEGESLDSGIFQQWQDRMAHYGGARAGSRVFDPNAARLAAEDLCIDAGVQLLFHHRAIHVQTADLRIDAIVLHSKTGLCAARAKTYIDSTGDGDVAALAGCRFEAGSETTGHAQPMTLCFKLRLDPRDLPEGFDTKDVLQMSGPIYRRIQEVYRAAQADGRIECPREDVLMFPSITPNVIHFNTTRVIHRRAIDGAELSDAEIQARRQLRQIWQVLREHVDVFRHSTLYSIAPQIGVRESRRIVGRVKVTVDDYKSARTFPDAVARVTYPIDIHNPDGKGTVIERLPAGQWYEVPFGCLLPADLDNLAIASRCIWADHATHSSLRVMPPVCSIGQAAGTAAAMAMEKGIDVVAVDGVELNTRLIAQGRNLAARPMRQVSPRPPHTTRPAVSA